MISEEIIQQIKDENNIVELVEQSGVRLKKAGKYYSGLCPFHSEKTPSFTVTPEKGIYKCFGCGEAGNSIVYTMKTKNLPFIEAVRYLADRAHIELEEEDGKTQQRRSQRNKYFEMNKMAGIYFHQNLKESKKAFSYLKDRGMSTKTIRKFGLGYAKDSWNELLNYLKSKGFTVSEITEVGLAISSENNKIYDRFRNRIIFPVFDYKGNVIGFGGRVLDDSKPKYLNSPESMIFHKGVNLFGLNFAIKEGIKDSIIIVEGYMDVISLHSYGITNAVASLGTALTIEQGKLLKRFVSKVIMCYDTDLAGEKATERGFKVLSSLGLEVKILRLDDKKDPDEFVKMHGKDKFLKEVENSIPLIDYRIKLFRERYDITTDKGKNDFINHTLVNLAQEASILEQDNIITKLSDITGADEIVIREYFKNIQKPQNTNNFHTIGQNIFLDKACYKFQRILLKLAMLSTKNFNSIYESCYSKDLFNGVYKVFFEKIIDFKNNNNSLEDIMTKIESKCDTEDLIKMHIEVKEENIIIEGHDDEKFISDCIKKLNRLKLENDIDILAKKIKECEKNREFDKTIELLRTIKEKQKNLKKL